MNYTTLDGTILESSPDGPVTYKQPVSYYNDGVYISYESGNSDGITQQIKVVREVINSVMVITITEQTQEDIDIYMKEIEQDQIDIYMKQINEEQITIQQNNLLTITNNK
jgi:hypothetical protein